MPNIEQERRELCESCERLRAALKPFARAAAHAEKDEENDYCLAGSSARHELNIGDLRMAWTTLEQGTQK